MAFGREKPDVYRAAIEYAGGADATAENETAKALLDRIVAMLTKLGQRGYAVHEEPGVSYWTEAIEPDPDTDPDERGKRLEPVGSPFR